MKVAWFSAGATSAVACKLAIQMYDDVEIYYIETGSHHPDSMRFLKECENWYCKKINILKSKYKDIFDVFEKIGFIHSAHYAPCTGLLKTRVRQKFEYEHPEITHYIWGFESGQKEENRAKRMCERYPEYKHLFPLIEKSLNKESCLALLQSANIEIPEMYKLGYCNNNCIGCVKGGMGYWNKIRVDFPETFNKMAELERKIGHSCLKQYFLDELPTDAGRKVCMFLKLTFLEGQERKDMFLIYPPKTVYVSSSRIKCAINGDFAATGESAACYAWFVWEKGYTGKPVIEWIIDLQNYMKII